MQIKKKWVSEEFRYDGSQLRSLFTYLNFGLMGDSILSWQGPCRVGPDEMVDGEDLVAGSKIEGDKMVHFIIEIFNPNLFLAVCIQRLFAALAMEVIRDLSPRSELTSELHRDGDDIFVGEKKHSISIATVSPVSLMIHFAVNIVNEGTPVPTIALQDFEIDSMSFAEELMDRFVFEMQTTFEATQKVRWVK